MNEILGWIRALSQLEAAALSLLVNLLVFAGALGGAHGLRHLFRAAPVCDPPGPLSRREVLLAAACVLCNALVMLVGWHLYRAGYLAILATASPARVVVDTLLLLLQMDLAMYVSHRLAHIPQVFRHVHGIHHDYVRVRPLTLFVLHPLEVLGFGALWIGMLALRPVSLLGMVFYLALNLLYGAVGHLGVEPLSAAWRARPLLRHLGTSTFHAAHHATPRANFGFYTSLWDRLFRTLL